MIVKKGCCKNIPFLVSSDFNKSRNNSCHTIDYAFCHLNTSFFINKLMKY